MTTKTTPAGAPTQHALRDVPFMGVIFVVHEASKLGFTNGAPDWSNLGQGQPEIGEMEGAPPRISAVTIEPEDHAYGPLGGTLELRTKIAAHYNRLYRRGKRSQYSAANVCVAQGGRLALTRVIAALGEVNVGYQLPDYTAYEDMLGLHLGRITPIPVRAQEKDGFAVPIARLAREVQDLGLGAYVLSNPCNPTGNVIQGKELEQHVALAREKSLTLILDEFYSHFIYTPKGSPGKGPVSGAAFIDDVEQDPVILIDGLTKSFRYPGWRVGWAIGPSNMMETLARTASSIDGGPSRIAQRAALVALEPGRADQETRAVREMFARKRNVMVERLKGMGITFAREPQSTFYCWCSLAQLKPPFNDAMVFFRRALEHKVLTVPGEFFDVNPGKRRRGASPYRSWMRFSFGPPMDNMLAGLGRLEDMLGQSSKPARRKLRSSR